MKRFYYLQIHCVNILLETHFGLYKIKIPIIFHHCGVYFSGVLGVSKAGLQIDFFQDVCSASYIRLCPSFAISQAFLNRPLTV